MKKLLFGLIATVLLSGNSIGQSLSDANKKSIINSQMVSVVNVLKPFYTKGSSYEDFVKNLLVPSPTTPTQDEFFKKVYGYISNGTADCDILKMDNSILSQYAMDLQQSPKNLSTPENSYSDRKKWWQILINTVLNVATDMLVTTHHETIDLWPDA